ncbi:cell division ATP-binding protein FtsE [Croceicoccus gelatinilyticus]|uniref:cell division ATP-binding protein FtsE n=1 Tax=Croceicoccus gelatinilyticus TaxID=2835536 RepID=UPI001BCDDC4D|nr:cell division ATP-binding protein FtsE [Croceicoccus gelatinilyticus]
MSLDPSPLDLAAPGFGNPTGPIVRFENVGLRYGAGREVLSDITFKLHPGRFYFLTGPSGAGKTTLLKLLYLAQSPSRGAISMFGDDASVLSREKRTELRRRIGVVFQNFRLVPHLTVFDNVALPLRLAGTAEEELVGPVTDMIEWVGLSRATNQRPSTLSGGEQQRVAIARAVITRPDLLVADEPTGNVDPQMALRLLHLFKAMNKMGTTVVLATHDTTLMHRQGDAAVMRLEKGRLDDPTGVLRNPPDGKGLR